MECREGSAVEVVEGVGREGGDLRGFVGWCRFRLEGERGEHDGSGFVMYVGERNNLINERLTLDGDSFEIVQNTTLGMLKIEYGMLKIKCCTIEKE